MRNPRAIPQCRVEQLPPCLFLHGHGREHPVTLARNVLLENHHLALQLDPQRLDVLVSLPDGVVGVLGEQLLPLLILTANPNPLLTLC